MDNCGVDIRCGTAEGDFAALLSPAQTPQQDEDWTAIGRGSNRARLESIVARLEAAWSKRWAYRIEEQRELGDERFQLFVRHL